MLFLHLFRSLWRAAARGDFLCEYITKDLYRFRAWLTSHNCFDVCMESTGRYWVPVFNILEDGGMRVVLTHPMHVRSIKGKKTDRNDATRIAGLFKHDLVGNSFIPPPEIRALRELARYRYKLVCMRSSERNRYQDCMTVSSIGLASALSDPFGQTATGIMRYVLSSEVYDEAAIGRPILKSAKKKTDLILESIRNFRIESDQRFKMNIVSAHMEHLDKAILATEVELCARIGPHMDIVKHLAEQLPGISLLYASLIISEIGADMTVFESDKHLASWAGLAPANNQSACKKSVRISKAGQFLKPLLVNCALAAIKSKSNPYFAVKYQKIKKRRGHKRAIVAICRMLLTCVYHMILKREAFNPSDMSPCTSLPQKNKCSPKRTHWPSLPNKAAMFHSSPKPSLQMTLW